MPLTDQQATVIVPGLTDKNPKRNSAMGLTTSTQLINHPMGRTSNLANFPAAFTPHKMVESPSNVIIGIEKMKNLAGSFQEQKNASHHN